MALHRRERQQLNQETSTLHVHCTSQMEVLDPGITITCYAHYERAIAEETFLACV